MLIIRAWVEPGAPAPLRARVTRSLDVRSPVSEVAVLGDVDEVCAQVRDWLTAVAASQTPDP